MANPHLQKASQSSSPERPFRILERAATLLNGPLGLWVSDNLIFTANQNGNSITEYPLGSSSNVAPLRTIAGS